ncbi:GIY-YIG nuclease family protein [Candidatus Daviesbacteria bacterium]|nr:GIY-YIG nuclease family protein [Candidatus Daviesbacteria bacterium]
MFIVYVLHNRQRNKLYIGQTADLLKRLDRHNDSLRSKHRSFTKINSGEWKLVYKEEYNTRFEALLREKQLKSSRGRSFVKSKYMAR